VTRRAWIVVGVLSGVIVLLLGSLFIVGVAFMATLAPGGGRWDEVVLRGSGGRKIAVVDVRGEIHTGPSESGLFGSGGAGSQDVVAQLEQARDDDAVAAVILRVDSPGGSVVASDDIAKTITRVREDKPVVSLMEDMAASGGYYVSAPTDRILANPGTITGSIGVIMLVPNLTGTAQKVGIKPQVIKSGKFKDAGSPFRDMTGDERALFQRMIDEAYGQFVGVVASGRKLAPAAVRKVADGRILTGTQAKAAGLIDDFGDLADAYDAALELAEVSRDDARLIQYQAHQGLSQLLSPFGAAKSPVAQVKEELGASFGLKYLFLR
jgi:protease IV